MPNSQQLADRAQFYSSEIIGDCPDRAITAMLEMLRSISHLSTMTPTEVLRCAGMHLAPGPPQPWSESLQYLANFTPRVRGRNISQVYEILLREVGVGPRHAECHIFSAIYPHHQFQFLEPVVAHQFVRNGFEIAATMWLIDQLGHVRIR